MDVISGDLMNSPPDRLQDPRTFRSDHWKFVVVCSAILAVAVFLRLYHLGTEELWLDEAASAHFITSWTLLLADNTPPLYYTLLKFWSLLAGTSEFGLRSLSALAGSLFVLATIWMGKEVFNESVGLWSGLFVAVNPMAIYYSQEARAYALLLLFLALTYSNLWKALKEGAWKNWLGFSLCALLALYSHYLALLALAPTVVLVLLWPAQEQTGHPWLYYSYAVVVCAVLFLPMVAFKSFGADQIKGVEWLEAPWRDSSPWLLIPNSLEVFGLGSGSEVSLLRLKQVGQLYFPVWFRTIGVSMLILLGVAALIPEGDQTLGVPWIGRRKIALVTLACVPLLLLLGISFMRPIYLVARYDMIGFPAYVILLGLGAAKIQHIDRFGAWTVWGVAICLLGVIGTKLFFYYRTSTPANIAVARATASFLTTNVKNGDVVVFTGLQGAPVLYYLRKLGYDWRFGRCVDENNGRNFGCRMFPRETESYVGAYEPRRVWNSRDEIRSDVSSFVRDLGNSSSSFWIVVGDYRVKSRRIRLKRLDYFLMTELKDLGYRIFPTVSRAVIVGMLVKPKKSNTENTETQ